MLSSAPSPISGHDRVVAAAGRLRRLTATVRGRPEPNSGTGSLDRALSSRYRSQAVADSIYRCVLGRYPTAAERAEIRDRAARGAGFDEVVAWLSDSDEAIERSVDRIGPVVRRALRRHPEVGGDRTRLVFMHIMKVGGTSLSDLMSTWVPQRQARSHQYIGDVLTTPRPVLAGLRMIAGHLPYEALSLIPGSFSTLCVLRDPRDRTISHYNTLRAAQPAYRELTLDEFLHSDVFDVPSGNYQARQLAHEIDLAGAWITYSPEDLYLARGGAPDQPYILQSLFDSTPLRFGDHDLLRMASEHLQQVEIVGVTDRLDAVARAAARLFDVPYRPVPHLNRSGATALKDIPSRLARGIDDRTAVDRELYDLAARRSTEEI